MIIDGNFTINASVQEVWDFLIDIERMSVCLPGVESVEQSDEQTYTGAVTVKVGPIATSFQGKVVLTVVESPKTLKAKLQGRDRKTASMVTGEFTSELSTQDGGSTEVAYKFDIAIRGRLGQFGQAVILDTSKQLTDEFVKCVQARVENPQAPAEQVAPRANVVWIALRAFFANLWAQLRGIFSRDKSS